MSIKNIKRLDESLLQNSSSIEEMATGGRVIKMNLISKTKEDTISNLS
jgi:hypothetical protein